MKIILLSMPDITPLILHQDALHIPNLGIASIGANIDSRHIVYTADLVRKRTKIKKFVTKIVKKIKPTMVGLSAMAWQYGTCIKIANLIKSIAPNILITIGGYHATLMFDEISNSPEAQAIDFIIRGEGEEAFNLLVNAVEDKTDLVLIPSLSWKKGNKFIHNERGGNLDLAKLNIPIRDNKRRLTGGYHINFAKIEVMETSRGCTRLCTFCSMVNMYGRTFRPYPIERVLRDIDDIYYNKKTKWIFISDDNMVLDKKRVLKLCDAIIAKKYKNLKLFVQADCVTIGYNEDMVQKMAEAGFRSIFLGIENASKKNLAKMKKGNIIEATKKAIANCHKYGILVIGGLIFGLPDDDEQSIIENYEFLKEAEADAAYCQIITPYPKTQMRDELIEAGLVTNLYNYKWYDGTWANVKTNNLDSDTLHYLFWYHRQKVLGWWKPSAHAKKRGMVWAWIWRYLMSPVLRFFINRQVKKYGWHGRYERRMKQLKSINIFKDLQEY